MNRAQKSIGQVCQTEILKFLSVDEESDYLTVPLGAKSVLQIQVQKKQDQQQFEQQAQQQLLQWWCQKLGRLDQLMGQLQLPAPTPSASLAPAPEATAQQQQQSLKNKAL
ncbi:hypothetical protein BGW38_000450 [Lunasporangiospora selenospora]|uniref:Uncharacterized protein n=1 Tax=Lunasporangiospora selenospora TaxID=979761 RepID=A0A9P6KID2_9FUNG|nr:hypothetical protein BGW38_000450 [Lunasporangiospora selenospora]